MRQLLRRLRDPGLALVVAVASFALQQWWDFRLPSAGAASYQAVFLASGQTYFGHYFDRIGPYARIDDVYYIQQLPQGEDPDKPPESRILRRGSELHAPLPRVLIAKTAILFVEDLRPTSPVAQFMDAEQGKR